jgi:hypothetical protein
MRQELLENVVAMPFGDPVPLLLAALELPPRFMRTSGERALPKLSETLFSIVEMFGANCSLPLFTPEIYD